MKDILSRLHRSNEQPAVFRYLKIRSQNLVSQPINWRMIQDLAHALVEKRSLSGDEALAVFHDSFQRQIHEHKEQCPAAGNDFAAQAPHTPGSPRQKPV